MSRDRKVLSRSEKKTSQFLVVSQRLGAFVFFISCSPPLLVFDTCPPLYFNCHLERSADSCTLSCFRMDVASTWRTSSTSRRADYDFKFTDCYWTGDVARFGVGR